MDAPLIALTQQCGGDLRPLLFAFFSFLNRRTDFFLVPHPDDLPAKMGFAEGDAEKLLLAAFRQFPLRRIPKGMGDKMAAAGGATSKTATAAAKSKEEPPKTKASEPKTVPKTANDKPTEKTDTKSPAEAKASSTKDTKS